jgi:chemotaxis protein methyltransferase CheR
MMTPILPYAKPRKKRSRGNGAEMEFGQRDTVRNTAMVLIRDIIHARTGIFFDEHNMDLMIDKVSQLIAERGIDSPLDYYYRLKYDNDRGEWTTLLDTISVRETFFWREFDQIRALVDVLLPQLARRVRQPIKIWSAACASGEEPLTIAMAIEQAGWFDRIPIEIRASDASDAAIRAATAGVYRERCFRQFPPGLRSRFFTSSENGWKIVPEIHQRVQWHRANLTVPSDIHDLAAADVIFCRNVFIYFSDASILKTVRVFEDRMTSPGYLFVGAAESLLKFATRLDLREIGGAFVYVKD